MSMALERNNSNTPPHRVRWLTPLLLALFATFAILVVVELKLLYGSPKQSNNEVPAGWLVYKSSKLTFRYPSGWNLKGPDSGGTLNLERPIPLTPSGFVFSAQITYWNSTDTPFCTAVLQCLKNDNFDGNATTTLIGGAVAVKGVDNIQGLAFAKPDLEGQIDILLDSTHGYEISYSPLDDPAALRDLDAVLSSFRFIR
jgi:hypothetical protein